MECYITRTEFDLVVKEVKRMQKFLVDTFGPKFVDFQLFDVAENTERRSVSTTDQGDNRSKSCSSRNQESLVADTYRGPVIAYPFNRRTSGNLAVVTSAKHLSATTSSPNAVRTDEFERCDVPVIQSSRISVSTIPPVTTSFSRELNGSDKVMNNGDNPLETKSVNSRQLGLNEIQSQPILAQTKGQLLSKTRTRPEFHLRGRTLYHNHKRSGVNNGTSNAAQLHINDELLPVVGIESMEGIPSPAKISRPPPLPSFKNRNRSLTLSSSEPLGKPSESPTLPNDKTNSQEIIQCELCNLFVYSSQLDNHMKNHTLVEGNSSDNISPMLNKTKICPICSMECADFQIYEQHFTDIHPEAGFPCPICSRRMSNKAKLRRHMTIHRNLKFECNICGKAYNRSDNLNAHYKTHGVNEKCSVFHCHSCTNAFASRVGRKRHIAFAHPEVNLPLNDDSQEDEDSEPEILESSTAALHPTIKVEGSSAHPEIEFEYEGDDDDD